MSLNNSVRPTYAPCLQDGLTSKGTSKHTLGQIGIPSPPGRQRRNPVNAGHDKRTPTRSTPTHLGLGAAARLEVLFKQ